ncbi:MAG TPA: DUF502 domain-containing protein [Thermoanaerobaculia bacterium]|nr:DUF502 domain-containing protein [Thermoanaerobaculia bacterium]HQR68198.1 DUF502 domain-containing protein [Thermoanaerobaculia bacterium]
MGHLVKYFVRGLIVFVPAAVSVFVLWTVFVKVDRLVGIPFPGAGLLATVALVTLLGFLASNFLTRRAFDLLDGIFRRVPFVKLVHGAARDLVNAFVGERKGFDRPVALSLGGPDAPKLLGFATRESISGDGLEGHVAVYVPQSYAFAGHVFVVPRARVTPLSAASADVMAFIVSGGVSGLAAAPPDRG